MKIAFDNQAFINQEYGGITRYLCELVVKLNAISDVQCRVVAPFHRNAYLARLPRAVAGLQVKLPFVPRTTKLIRAASGILSEPLLRKFDPDVIHRTYYADGPAMHLRAKKVVTVHDMIHEIYPNHFPGEAALSAEKRRAVEAADLVICISRKTQSDLQEHFGTPIEKTMVVYHGYEVPTLLSANQAAVHSITNGQSYVLYVGARSAHKNFDRLLEAFASSKRLRTEQLLVCFGGGELKADEHAKIEALGLLGRVLQIGGADDLLSSLYRQAALFVYPSLYEGFGIPPLEAMAAGCPVVCSRGGSIPEIVGDAAILFDPEDVNNIGQSIEQVLGSPGRQRELRERGLIRCRNFSWTKCAVETRQAYASLF